MNRHSNLSGCKRPTAAWKCGAVLIGIFIIVRPNSSGVFGERHSQTSDLAGDARKIKRRGTFRFKFSEVCIGKPYCSEDEGS